MKCGFPINQLSKYSEIFNQSNISFLIVDDINTNSPISCNNYLLNTNFSNFITKIQNLDLLSTTPIQSLNLLIELKDLLNKEDFIKDEK